MESCIHLEGQSVEMSTKKDLLAQGWGTYLLTQAA